MKHSKNPIWRQSNPVDQLVAIRSSMEGHISNFESNVISKEKLITRLNDHLIQIEQLEFFLKNPQQWSNDGNS